MKSFKAKLNAPLLRNISENNLYQTKKLSSDEALLKLQKGTSWFIEKNAHHVEMTLILFQATHITYDGLHHILF